MREVLNITKSFETINRSSSSSSLVMVSADQDTKGGGCVLTASIHNCKNFHEIRC